MNNRIVATIPATELKLKTGEVIRRVAVNGEHLIIERGKIPTAVMIPINDYKSLLEAAQKLESTA